MGWGSRCSTGRAYTDEGAKEVAAHKVPHIRWEAAVVAGCGGPRVQGPYSKGNIQETPREMSGRIRNK